MSKRYKKLITDMFLKADVRINGDRPFDIQVKNEGFYRRVLRDGQLGIGESYMDGWWECDAIDEMTSRFIRANLLEDTAKNIKYILNYFRVQLSDIGRISKAFEVGEKHYDLGNDLFENMLDKRMVYSCGYWANASNLEEAQEAKLDLICKKAGLKPGMRVLEIGCGWGSWAKFAAEKYGVEVVGVTVSVEQAEYAREYCKGLPVEIRVADYRTLDEEFDRVVSIAMFEAVGHKYFRTFMKVVDRCLKPDGLFVLHTIVGRTPIGPAQSTWLNKYIFPNGELPTLWQLSKSVEDIFVEEAYHHLIGDYEKTLAAWYDNFIANWDNIKDDYDERFFRMWVFYLKISKGIFMSRLIHLWQFVYSKDGISKAAGSFIHKHTNNLEPR